MSHPWMSRGFSGPPDVHMPRREPLRADELDKQVIRGMQGFQFGTEEEIERKLISILTSDGYIHAVQHWERKQNIVSNLNGHVRRGGCWGELSNSSLTTLFDSNNADKDPSTPLKKSSRVSGFSSYWRKLFSIITSSPRTPFSLSPSSSFKTDSYLTLANPTREPSDPTSGFHSLLSMYYLSREKLERERV